MKVLAIATHQINDFWVSEVTLVAVVAYHQDEATHDHQQHNPTHHNACNLSSVRECVCCVCVCGGGVGGGGGGGGGGIGGHTATENM